MYPYSIQLGREIAEERIAEARRRHLVKVVRRNESSRPQMLVQRIGQLLVAVGTRLIERTQLPKRFDLESNNI